MPCLFPFLVEVITTSEMSTLPTTTILSKFFFKLSFYINAIYHILT